MKINIPIPCHENWENMTSQDKGRFCGSCQKVVVDFTKMSNDEIIDYFKKQETKKSTCGRFYDVQLRQINQETNSQDITKDFFLKKFLQKTAFWASSFVFFLGNAPQKAFAQTENLQKIQNPNVVTENEFLLKCVVIDEDSKDSLIQALIHIKDTNKGIVTNENGYFEMFVKENDILLFTYAGYKSKELMIKKNFCSDDKITFELKPENNNSYVVINNYQHFDTKVSIPGIKGTIIENLPMTSIGDVSMDYYKKKSHPNIFLRTWRGIKSIFRRKKD